MATATFSHASQYHSVNQDSMSNEFGGITNGSHPTNWDEEVVPALKKRLEADRVDLDRRISATDFNYARLQSTKPRPIPRKNANDEILQDGLGDDELIPSEWATGSKARFLTANRDNSNAYTISRSASDLYSFDRSHQDYHDNHDSYAVAGDTLSPDSPPLQDGMNSGTDMVAHARERARKLARERSRGGTEMEATNSLQSDENRMRTKSSPGLGDRYNQEPGESRYANTTKAPISRSHSPSDGRRTPSSKIPLPVSGSMSRVANSPRSVRGKQGTMGEGEFGYMDQGVAYNESPRPDDEQQKQPLGDISNHSGQTTPAKKKQKANTVTRRATSSGGGKRIQNSPPTQDVLDEFGPLGGTPRRTMDTSTGEFGDISRASSNPWDEELLPTVKRRLAQEAMMNDPRLSQVDGLVDAWDRNGVPISTRAVSGSSSRMNGMRQAAEEQQGLGGANGTQSDGYNEDVDERKRKDLLTPEHSPKNHSQEQRMKRLTDQLDLGFQPGNEKDEIEMAQVHPGKREKTRMDQQKKKSKHFAHDPSMPTLTQSQQLSQTKGKADNQKNTNHSAAAVAKKEEEGAGCCQCSIM
ncbi:uncharacterized protein FA14DRAFT_66640 [Meira miltonrushii]|uniref:Uncharacterized protein n=1 Tax=Meira miltonrushii TaxID=1280837 RepID=A0A316V8T6_9BASI|nr:uncharacterized protein FA14DRAFT_66640 [Meira miltonrushii]PWN33936.1 hypothetical protein FA14DRAFT_66640 [Meira miltonrushii]